MTASRILILMHDFAGGGTERVAIRLANEWTRSGRQVRIFCGVEDGPTRDLVAAGVQVKAMKPSLPRSIASRISLGRALREEACRWRPDIVFGTGNFHLPAIAVYHAARATDAKTVCKLSNPLGPRGPARLATPVHGLGLRLMTRDIDALVTMSPSLHAEASTLLRRKDILIAPEPILIDPAGSDSAGSPAEPPEILCAGRLERQKNFSLAITAFAAIPRKLGARLTILGEGSQRGRLERLVDRLDLGDRVTLPGHSPDIRNHLVRASAFLCTSRFEGYPAVLIEAIALGVPVVTTACSPAIREIVHHKTVGTIVETNSPVEIAECLSASLLNRSRKAADSPVQRHHVERAAAHYLRLLDRVSSRPAHR